ncbi:hypothetical protein J4G66_03055 [Aeromonas dhakensis]|uniref:hypothetical protein n=1 Tax=Aeromonas dhakensis TaxID=196024 RepID=UPI001BCC19F4|nr:hypothetical protein [Aeromonas dhakensis]MBS4714953.1 hypothetical protein [Aeromonas dhakensis]
MIETERDKQCTVCGERSACASWICRGGDELSVCIVCATQTLPQLIADAVFGAMPAGIKNGVLGTPRKYSDDAFKDITANYYKALSHSALGGLIKPLTFSCLKCSKRQTVSGMRVTASEKKQFVQCIECGYAHEISWALSEDVTAVEDDFVQSVSVKRASTDSEE